MNIKKITLVIVLTMFLLFMRDSFAVPMPLRTVLGNVIAVEVDYTDTVLDVKRKVKEKTGWPIEIQRLIIGGVELSDEKTMNYYDFVKNPTVHIVLRMAMSAPELQKLPIVVYNKNDKNFKVDDWFVYTYRDKKAAIAKITKVVFDSDLNVTLYHYNTDKERTFFIQDDNIMGKVIVPIDFQIQQGALVNAIEKESIVENYIEADYLQAKRSEAKFDIKNGLQDIFFFTKKLEEKIGLKVGAFVDQSLKVSDLKTEKSAVAGFPLSKSTSEAIVNIPLKTDYSTFKLWYDACHNFLVPNIEKRDNICETFLTWAELEKVTQDFFDLMMDKDFLYKKSNLWMANAPGIDDIFFDVTKTPNEIFKPFIQKLSIPASSVVALHGDLHGDIFSLLAFIKDLQAKNYLDSSNAFKIINSNFYMLFLGDYTDRGCYGAEVLYTIMRLKVANLDKVFMVRGNHEDIAITTTIRNGFRDEFRQKFRKEVNVENYFLWLSRMYDFLPAALYLGVGDDYIQCCHGGMELGYNPQNLLNQDNNIKFEWLLNFNKNRQSEFNKAQEDFRVGMVLGRECLGRYGDIGFMWNDFFVDSETILGYDRGRGFIYGKLATRWVLDLASDTKSKVHGVFRAHQHTADLNAMMRSIIQPGQEGELSGHKGISKLWKDGPDYEKVKAKGGSALWDGIVCTFLVGVDSVYSQGGTLFDFDAFGILTTAPKFDDWRLQVYRNNLEEKILPVKYRRPAAVVK